MGFFSFSLFATLLARVWLTVGRSVGFLAIVALFVHFGRRSQNPLHSIPFRFRYDVYERTFLGAFLFLSTIAVVILQWIALYSFFLHCHCSDRSGDCTWVLMYAMFLSYLWWCWCRCLFWPIYSIFQCLCALIPLLVWFARSLFAAIITKDILSFRIYNYMSIG